VNRHEDIVDDVLSFGKELLASNHFSVAIVHGIGFVAWFPLRAGKLAREGSANAAVRGRRSDAVQPWTTSATGPLQKIGAPRVLSK
jgi:aryl-alcohol dehydrogenase-like predicted oxidoreductase